MRFPFLSILMALMFATGLGLAACQRSDPANTTVDDPGAELPDTLSAEEQLAFAIDLERYQEMANGRLDTVDMLGRAEDTAWHVQVLNYRTDLIAMTYATWYSGPDSAALMAVDDQPHLEDNLGNVYSGVAIPSNPRFKVDSGTTAAGVYVFTPAVDTRADSLTLFINDSTPPVIRVGPFGIFHDHTSGLSQLSTGMSSGLSSYKLEIVSLRCSKEGGYVRVNGEVRNISSESLEDVEVVASFSSADGTLVKSGSALIDFNPLLPGQSSAFEARAEDDPEVSNCNYIFRKLGGEEIRARIP
jgi:hypothetical protein